MTPSTAAVGFRVKSGFAAAVVVTGSRRDPRLVRRDIAPLSDPDKPRSAQPYHAAIGTHQPASEAQVTGLVRVVEAYASRSLADLLERYAALGLDVRGAGIIVGSDIDPGTIANDHIRAHALEGQLFRRVVETGLERRQIPFRVIRDRDIYREAPFTLQSTDIEVRKQVAAWRPPWLRPWRADEKSAALAAWMMLP